MKFIYNFLLVFFSRKSNWLMALLFALLFMVLGIWLANYSFISFIIGSDFFPWLDKLGIILNIPELIKAAFGIKSFAILAITAILFGINFAAIVIYFKRQSLGREVGVGFFGVIWGALGLGCLSCGSVILSSVLGLSTAVAVLSFLPFNGLELNLLSIFFLLLSIYLLAKKISGQDTCRVKY